jgi:hypothetical protein
MPRKKQPKPVFEHDQEPTCFLLRVTLMAFPTPDFSTKEELKAHALETISAAFHDFDDLEVEVKGDTDPDWDESW